MIKLIIVLSFFSLRFLYTISKLWGFLNISHLNDCKRLIKIQSFFATFEVRNVEICTYFLESAKKMAVYRKWDHSDYIFAMIAVRISYNTFENHFSLVRNVTEKCVSVSTVPPMTNDYTLWHVPFFALNFPRILPLN